VSFFEVFAGMPGAILDLRPGQYLLRTPAASVWHHCTVSSSRCDIESTENYVFPPHVPTQSRGGVPTTDFRADQTQPLQELQCILDSGRRHQGVVNVPVAFEDPVLVRHPCTTEDCLQLTTVGLKGMIGVLRHVGNFKAYVGSWDDGVSTREYKAREASITVLQDELRDREMPPPTVTEQPRAERQRQRAGKRRLPVASAQRSCVTL
jgi:hypothetical protein